eukprot:TRINITY_DN23670_c0_g1_i1.p3 TRINITY_DN23670_c0_g1~~TRINITY_DN23670_c0_g1_i1.p3  ORF type:complete len:126 (+),score=4.48 TRINITY_DN23670_c0_g1_i1:26-379(+)
MADKCGKCGKTAYPTEKVTALGKAWHKFCFKCAECGSTIELGKELGHEGMPYCKRCHQSKFGIGGYGYGQGGTLSSHKYNTANQGSQPSATGGKNFCSGCGAAATGGGFCSGCGNKL